jgi:hypothetical protein
MYDTNAYCCEFFDAATAKTIEGRVRAKSEEAVRRHVQAQYPKAQNIKVWPASAEEAFGVPRSSSGTVPVGEEHRSPETRPDPSSLSIASLGFIAVGVGAIYFALGSNPQNTLPSQILESLFFAVFAFALIGAALKLYTSRSEIMCVLCLLLTPQYAPFLVIIGGAIAALGGNLFLAAILLGAGVCGGLGRVVAIRSKKNLGGLVGLLLGPIGVVVAAVLKDDE